MAEVIKKEKEGVMSKEEWDKIRKRDIKTLNKIEKILKDKKKSNDPKEIKKAIELAKTLYPCEYKYLLWYKLIEIHQSLQSKKLSDWALKLIPWDYNKRYQKIKPKNKFLK
jgi:hypothetical protein